MANEGWATLGHALTGGNALDSELAFTKGEALAGQTQNALAQARQRILENSARENIGSKVSAIPGMNPDLGSFLTSAIQGNFNPETTLSAQKTSRETTTRQHIADPTTSGDQRQLDLASLANAPIKPFEEVGPASYADVMHPDEQPKPVTSDLGATLIDKNKAETSAAAAQVPLRAAETKKATAQADAATAVAANGGKAQAGYQWAKNPDGTQKMDENGQPVQTPITGGSKDPNGAGAPLGSREAAMLGRVIGGARQSIATLRSILAAPTGASSGTFGIGAAPGHSLLHSTLDTFRNAASSDDTQVFNTLLPGLERNLASIETMGMVPQGTFTGSFANLAFRDGDSEETRLHKLAEMRQIVDNGTDVLINNPRLPEQQRKYLQNIQNEVRQVVPFTHTDLFRMKGMPPGSTVGDAVNAATNPGGAAPVPTPGGKAPTYNDEAEAQAAEAAGKLKKGTKVTIGGVAGTWQ